MNPTLAFVPRSKESGERVSSASSGGYPHDYDPKQDQDKHRHCSEDFSNPSPQVTVPSHVEQEYHPTRAFSHGTLLPDVQEEPDPKEGRKQMQSPRRRKRKTWMYVVLGLVLAALGLGLGLGLTFGRRQAATNVSEPNSGVVGIDFGDGTRRMTLYFQHISGQIRKSDYKDGVWSGGTGSDSDVVVTENVKSGTPLMALSYVQNDELTQRVLYVDNDDFLEEAVNSNKSVGWSNGFLGAGQFKASSSDHRGLSACMDYDWYGDPLGIRLYYGSAGGSIQELSWSFGDDAWEMGYTFPDSNADGGCECTVRGLSTTYVWLLNLAGQLELRWFDFNTSTNSTEHPTGTWNKGATYANVRNDSAIAGIQVNDTRLVHFQDNGDNIMELVTINEAENLTWTGPYQVGVGVEGTKLSAVVLNTDLGGQEIHVFFQETVTAISDFIRTLVGETWSQQAIPIGT